MADETNASGRCQVSQGRGRPGTISDEITPLDRELFFRVVSVDLDPVQIRRIVSPETVFSCQKAVLAVHWHPEFIPLDLIRKRLNHLFPLQETTLVIPTQHNEIMDYDGFSGVEVDCLSRGFNQKVQLLLHFKSDRLKGAHTLKKMLSHTFQYRSSQLSDFMDTIVRPRSQRIQEAAAKTGADNGIMDFVRLHVEKIQCLMKQHRQTLPPQSMKNKVLRNFFDLLRPLHGDPWIDRVQTYLTAVKKIVKAQFPLTYFFRTSHFIEETRGLGGGIVIPHPEQFWPVLLAGYDVDGVEVWNPQSRRYTDFLVSVIQGANERRGKKERKQLIFMGDDTHFGEKIKDPLTRDPAKFQREIGVQPPWDDSAMVRKLARGHAGREQVIQAYRERLSL